MSHINSSPPCAAYMRQWAGSALFQAMACRLFGAKPLPEPMLVYCQLYSWEQISVKFESEFSHFHSRKCIRKCRLSRCQPFCPRGVNIELDNLLVKDTPGYRQWRNTSFALSYQIVVLSTIIQQMQLNIIVNPWAHWGYPIPVYFCLVKIVVVLEHQYCDSTCHTSTWYQSPLLFIEICQHKGYHMN